MEKNLQRYYASRDADTRLAEPVIHIRDRWFRNGRIVYLTGMPMQMAMEFVDFMNRRWWRRY